MAELKENPSAADVVARLRGAMDAGFSLSHVVRLAGVSQYRASVILNNTAQGRVAGGEFNGKEIKAISDYLDSVKKRMSTALEDDSWVDALDVALEKGIKLSSVCRGCDIPVPLMCYRRSRSKNQDQLVNYFSSEEQSRLKSHLESVRDSI
ncbi:hypothetical protein [Erwinia phage Gungnir39]|nr:hypothetical protein [Erwinia phage Gungnir39]